MPSLYIDKIDWPALSVNPNAISILEKNIDKIHWYNLSVNPNAIRILEKNIDKISIETVIIIKCAQNLLNNAIVLFNKFCAQY